MQGWGLHTDLSTVPDSILQAAAGDNAVSFVFSCQVAGRSDFVEKPVQLRTGAAAAAAAGEWHCIACYITV